MSSRKHKVDFDLGDNKNVTPAELTNFVFSKPDTFKQNWLRFLIEAALLAGVLYVIYIFAFGKISMRSLLEAKSVSNSITAEELYRDLKSDETFAKEKYEGKVYTITGRYVDVTSSDNYVRIGPISGDRPSNLIELHFNKYSKSDISAINGAGLGAKVTATGKFFKVRNDEIQFVVDTLSYTT